NNIAGDGGGVFFTESSKVLFDKDVLFSGNKTNGMMNLSYGGAIYSYKSTYTFNGSQYFENNATAYAKGGAIYADASIFTFGTNASVTSFTNNTITGNSSFGGAAIYALNSTLNFNSYISSFTGNKTIGETSVSGGAIYVSGSYMNFQGETYFDGNVATSMGGAIAFVGGNLVFGKDVSFQKNQAVDGGAIYIGGSVSNTLSFNGNVLLGGTNGYGNKASEFSLRGGGAIFIGTNGGTHTLNFASDKNVKFENNSAGNGGAISMYSNAVNTLHFNNGVGFYSNTASLNGGAVNSYVYGAGNLGTYNFLKTGVFENNSAGDSGGAIYALTQSVFNIGAYDFVGNSSSGTNVSGGGAIYSDGSTFVFGASVQADTVNNFTGNSANGVGGAIFQNRSDSTFYNQGIFYDNSAGLSGGAVYASSGTMTFASSVLFESNNASGDFITSGGGAIYTFAQTLKLLGGSEFKNNKAQGVTNGSGGAVYASGSYLVFDGGVLFSQNLSETEGGAVYLTGKGKIEFTDAQFLSNSAGTNGGAIYLKGSSASEIAEIYFNKTTLFNANTANGSANAIHFAGNAYVEFNLQNQTANINDSITASAANNTLTACGGGTFNMNDNILGYQSLNLNLDAVTFNFAAGAMSLNDMSLSNSVLNMQDALAIAQTVSISGDLTLDSQSELRLDVFAGGDCDVINVGGTASLDGAINVKPGVGTYDNEWFTLINAYGGFNGTDFSSAVFQDTFVHRTDPCDLKYNFEFDASQNRYMLVVNGIRQSYFSQVDGMGRNQKNVAAMYDNLSANASRPLANVINSINDMPDISQLDALLETAPYFIANALNYSLHNRSKRDLFSHIEKSDKTNNVWAYADGGGSLVFQSDINSPGDFETADYGAVFGADRKLSPNFMLGFYGKYNIANISQGKSEGNITSYGLGTYALANKNAWQFKAALGYEGQSYDITRSIVMSDTSVRSAKTEFNSYLLEADI
ncbi:MAG: hypothetical protein FWC88_05585, partial [Endomicrobia bacterium]|nr:hypothetical protein [Endomicrobiia bacterium]